jgi:hypothetical protein
MGLAFICGPEIVQADQVQHLLAASDRVRLVVEFLDVTRLQTFSYPLHARRMIMVPEHAEDAIRGPQVTQNSQYRLCHG